MKNVQYLPILLWLMFLGATFQANLKDAVARLEVINLTSQYVSGGFSILYNAAAFASFVDTAAALFFAVLLARYLKSKSK